MPEGLLPAAGVEASPAGTLPMAYAAVLHAAPGRRRDGAGGCPPPRAILSLTALRAEGGLQVFDMMAMSKFIKTTFITMKIMSIHMTAQSLVISSKCNSPATKSQTQACTPARFGAFTLPLTNSTSLAHMHSFLPKD